MSNIYQCYKQWTALLALADCFLSHLSKGQHSFCSLRSGRVINMPRTAVSFLYTLKCNSLHFFTSTQGVLEVSCWLSIVDRPFCQLLWKKHMCTYIHIHACMQTYTHTHTYMHTHIHMYGIRTYIYTGTCIYAYTCVRIHIHIHICTHTYISMYDSAVLPWNGPFKSGRRD